MKQLTLLGLSLFLTITVTFTAFAQKEKNKQNQKEQKQNQGKNQNKPDKGNAGRNENKGQPGGKKEQKDNGAIENRNDNKNKNDEKGNNGKNDDNKDRLNKGGHNEKDGYSWDRETFKDRNKIKNGEKVTICHKFNRDDEPAVTIRVSSNALKAHMNHGDVRGDCPAVKDSRYSDTFLRNRNDYYNNLQNSQEQVIYSRSILDYALARLTASRSQLATLQNNNMPVADIQRKQATVVELEQNVSLLETLLGITANIVANKLK